MKTVSAKQSANVGTPTTVAYFTGWHPSTRTLRASWKAFTEDELRAATPTSIRAEVRASIKPVRQNEPVEEKALVIGAKFLEDWEAGLYNASFLLQHLPDGRKGSESSTHSTT